MSGSTNNIRRTEPSVRQMKSCQSLIFLINRAMLLAITLLFAAWVVERVGIQLKPAISLPISIVLSSILLGSVSHRPALGKKIQIEGILALVVVCASILSINRLDAYPDLWAGFGSVVLLTELLLIGILVLRSRFGLFSSNNIQKWFINFCSSVVFFVYVPVLIQPSYGLLNLGDTTYHVLDEILAPLVGKLPYFDYSPQYTSIYGWLLVPLKTVGISATTTMSVVILLCNILIIAVPLLIVRIAMNVLSDISFLPAFLAVVSIMYVSGTANGASVQMKEFSTFGRAVPLLISFAILTAHFFSDARFKKWGPIVLGLSIGLAFLNNPEMGLLFLVCYLNSIAIPVIRRIASTKDLSFVVTTAFVVFVTYFLVGYVITGQIDPSSLIGIRLGGNSLYPEASIDLFGAHVVCIGLAIAAVSRGLQLQLSHSSSSIKIRISILEICSGLLLSGVLVKFFLFPVGPGVLQLLIPSLLSAIFLIADFGQDFRLTSISSWKQFVLLGPSFLIALLPIGALTQAPYPPDEYRRILFDHSGETDWSTTPGRPSDGWSISSLNESYDSLVQRVGDISADLDRDGVKVMYFGIFGNTIQLVTGVKNGLGIAAPESLRFGGNQLKLACLPVEHYQPKFVIVYQSDFPCSGYELSQHIDFQPFQIFVHLEQTP